MVPLKLFSFPFFILFFLHQPFTTNCSEFCQEISCGPVLVDFPFRLTNQPQCCGNPNFSISCINRAQTIIAFPFSGEFRIEGISYSTPNSLIISDPDFCIPKRLLKGLDLSATPFKPQYPVSYMFFNCPSNVSVVYPAIGFSCLSGKKFKVLAIPTIAYNSSSTLGSSCLGIAKILVPLAIPDWPKYYMDNLLLTWENPDCQTSCNYCESRGEPAAGSNCSNDGGCSSDDQHSKKKSTGLSSGTRYALIFILGSPILLFLVHILHLNIRVHCFRDQLPPGQSNFEISSLAAEPQSAASTSTVNIGLGGPMIETYPLTVLGESCRLPRPNDNTCSICLSEYKAKETIRTVTGCGHYFHAACIDEWLKLNAACPVCRNKPDQHSALITHSTSFHSSSSSSPPPPHR